MGSGASLSVIVPAHNEERRLASSLERLIPWAARRTPPADILIVEGGSSDATASIAEDYARRHDGVRVIRAPLGKGRAIASGVKAASGELLYMCDVDLSTP